MYPWTPLTNNKTVDDNKKEENIETFITESETRKSVGSIFIAMGVMIVAAIISILFYWSYHKEKTLFIAIFAGIIFIYSIQMLVLVTVLRSKLNNAIFKLYMGTVVFMTFLSFILLVIFGIKAAKKLNETSSSPYVNENVQSYINKPLTM